METVSIYSGPGCKYCALAKEFFKQKGINFKEYDISKDNEAREKLKRLGIKSIPYMEAGNKAVLGFEESTILSNLGLE